MVFRSNKFTKMLKYFDFLSKQPEFFINGEQRYHTFIGVIFSLLASMLNISIIGFFLSQLTARKTFQIYDNVLEENYPVLDYSNFTLAASLVKPSGEPISSRIFEFTFLRFDFYLDQDSKVQRNTTFANKIQLCDAENIKNNYNLTKDMYCIAPGFNKTLYGKQGNYATGFSAFFLRIFMCKNGTFYDESGQFHNNTNCADQATINKELNQVAIRLLYIDTSMFHQNFEPFTSKLVGTNFLISPGLYRDIFFRFQLIEYNSDSGYLFEEISTYKSFQVASTETLINTRTFDSGLFAAIRFVMNDKNISYTREYMKLQVVLANIGGFIKFILIIAQFIVEQFSEKSYYLYLIGKYYAVERKESIIVNTNPSNFVFSTIDNNTKLEKINLQTNQEQPLKSITKNNYINYKVEDNVQKEQCISIQNNDESLYIGKLKKMLTKNQQLTKLNEIYSIWDLICILFKRKKPNIQRLMQAKLAVKKMLSMNTLIRMNYKIENLINIIFTDKEIQEFNKIKRKPIDEEISLS